MGQKITLDRALDLISNETIPNFDIEAPQQELDSESLEIFLRLKEQNDLMDMRRSWSRWILRSIIAVILFDFFVILAIGYNWMHFPAGLTIPFFIGESVLKTLGLAGIIVAFLFNQNSLSNKKS